MVGLNFLHVLQEGVKRLARKVIAVKRYQATARANQRGAGVKIERRWRVNVDAVVIGFELLQRFAQLEDFVARLKLGLQLVQQWAGWHQVQPFMRGRDNKFGGLNLAQAEAQGILKKSGNSWLVRVRTVTHQIST